MLNQAVILFNLWLVPGAISFLQAQTTGSELSYLTAFEQQVLTELNKVRANPSQYAEKYLEPMLTAFEGKILHLPGSVPLQTKEGKKALIECIREMKRTPALPLLTPSEGLSKAARILVREQAKNGRVGHMGSDGSTPQGRIEQAGQWKGKIAENIAYGDQSPFRVVTSLLIDDGVRDRSHRKNILDQELKTVGIASGEHPHYSHMIVMEMASSFQTKNQ